MRVWILVSEKAKEREREEGGRRGKEEEICWSLKNSGYLGAELGSSIWRVSNYILLAERGWN